MDRFGLFYSHFLTILSQCLLSSLGSDENSATIFILFLPCLKCPCPLATFRFFSSSLLFCRLTLNVAKCDFLFVLASWFYRLLSIIQFGNFLSNASCFNYFLPGLFFLSIPFGQLYYVAWWCSTGHCSSFHFFHIFSVYFDLDDFYWSICKFTDIFVYILF